MDASAYLRRKTQTMHNYIGKPASAQDARFYAEQKGRVAAYRHYVSPNVHVALPSKCDVANVGYTGSASAESIRPTPGCCTTHNTYNQDCCSMIYDPAQPVPQCKVIPYVAPPSAQREAATRCCTE